MSDTEIGIQGNDRPGLELSVKRAEELLKGVMIPPQPTVLVKVLGERAKPEPDLGRIAEVISADVALSASMLKVVNSPFFGLRRKIGSITHAVNLLGVSNVVNIASGLMLKAAFADQRGPFMDAFWRNSARNAVVSTIIANRTGAGASEDAYAVGLFCDCGIPILRRKFPNYGDLYATALLEVDRTFTEFEEDIIGTNHAVVGFMMANGWMLPDLFAQSILQHHDPLDHFEGASHRGSDPIVNMQAIMHMALHVCRRVDYLNVAKEWDDFGASVTAFLGMSEEDVEKLVKEVSEMPADGFVAF